jgi:hypothetical protein
MGEGAFARDVRLVEADMTRMKQVIELAAS